MPIEFLQNLSEMEIVGNLTVLSLLIGGIIMAVGIICKSCKSIILQILCPYITKRHCTKS